MTDDQAKACLPHPPATKREFKDGVMTGWG